MSEVRAPRYLAGLVSNHGLLRSRLPNAFETGVRPTPCVPGCQTGIVLYIHNE